MATELMSWSYIVEGLQHRNALLLAVAVALAAGGCSRVLRRKASETHKRGVRLSDGASLQRRATRRAKSAPESLTMAGIAIPAADETKHFKLIGTTGTGKSTAIRELLAGALARGDRAVFADPDAAYLSCFYDRYRGDIVLNPFERDSAKWDLFAEIDTNYDVEQLASGLIPGSEDAAASEWRGYARTFLAAVVRHCWNR